LSIPDHFISAVNASSLGNLLSELDAQREFRVRLKYDGLLAWKHYGNPQTNQRAADQRIEEGS
jgi:hypothetical protein